MSISCIQIPEHWPPSTLPPPCTPEEDLRRSLSGNPSGQISTYLHDAIPVNYCRMSKNRNVEDLYEKYIGFIYRSRVDPEMSLSGQCKDGHLSGGVVPAQAGIHENAGFRIRPVLDLIEYPE
jgi:hypothetical protein